MTTGRRYCLVIAVILTAFAVPAFSSFFTNDDFFHLYVSQPDRLLAAFSQFHHFRPLTTQGYYLISALTGNSVTPLRIISLLTLLLVGFLVFNLVKQISGSLRTALTACLLYLTSATHYAHLNYAGAYQELGLAVAVLAGVSSLFTYPWVSIICFVVALASKETAVVYPSLVLLFYLYFPRVRACFQSYSRFAVFFSAHIVILVAYFLFRLNYFPLAIGDSYIWGFSPRIINTLGWYGLWSLNLPEMWVDFVGPGLHINPNLLRYWAIPTLIISVLFLILLLGLFYTLIHARRLPRFLPVSVLWFIFSLGPLLFLPWHKFTFYLTIPLVAAVTIISSLLDSAGPAIRRTVLITWVLLSISTYFLTVKTNWITQGELTALRFHDYFLSHQEVLSGRTLILHDTPADTGLPWSPAAVLKTTLSDQNYFQLYSPTTTAVYLSQPPAQTGPDEIGLAARSFLGY